MNNECISTEKRRVWDHVMERAARVGSRRARADIAVGRLDTWLAVEAADAHYQRTEKEAFYERKKFREKGRTFPKQDKGMTSVSRPMCRRVF